MGEKGQPNATAVAGLNSGNVVGQSVGNVLAGVGSGQGSQTAGQSTGTTSGEKGQGISAEEAQQMAQVGLA